MIKELTPEEIDLPVNSDLKDALHNFDTDTPLSIVRLLEKGYSRDNKYRITTVSAKFILRNYKAKEVLQRLYGEHKLLTYLISENFPVPSLAKAKNGSYIYTNNSGLWTMREYVEGSCDKGSYTLTDPQLIAAGILLARYHKIVEHYPYVKKRNIPWHVNPQRTMSLLNAVSAILTSKSKHDGTDQLIVPVIAYKLQRLKDLQEVNAAIPDQPKLQIHGDFHGANIIFGLNGAVNALIDWEHSDYWMRIAEVQASICMMCKENMVEHFNVPINFRRARIFLDAYETVYPLATEEKTLMPVISQLDSLRLDFILYNHYILGISEYDTFIPKDTSCWSWWDDHAEEYTRVLAL